MLKYLQKRFALSSSGAKDFSEGVFYTTLLNICLMFSAVIVFLFLEDYLQPLISQTNHEAKSLWFYIGIGILFIAITWVVAYMQYNSTYTKVYNESANRRISLAEKLRKLPLAFFGEKNLSDLTSTLMDDSTDLEMTFSHAVPQLFASIISVCLVAVGLFFYNWQLALSLFWVVPFASCILIFSKRFMHKQNKKHYWVKRGVTEKISEGLEMVQEIKSYNQEEKYLNQLNKKLDVYEKGLVSIELVAGSLVNSAQAILKLGMASVVLVGAFLLAEGTISMFVYLIFLMVSANVYQPINDVFNHLAALFYLDVRINRMNEMLDLSTQHGDLDFNPPHFDIEFKNVNFSYESGKAVLQDVSFTAKQGEITALVGPSGGGKSTTAKLAARFWDIDSGSIKLGGIDISSVDPEELLKYYSVVFQDVVLFDSSVADNIKMGNPKATMEDVKRVAKLAQCDEFILKMPEGYDTLIGENGANLSGGERQRISIARALLKDAPIVLLDEATASLDVENETKIQAGISELVKDKTVLVIAHRLRTIANADKIVTLKEGQVENIIENK